MAETNPRDAIREARAARLKLIQGELPPATVKVYAANELMRGVLRHPNGPPFRETLNEPVEWPNDSFTARRIREGSVLTEAGSGGEWTAPDPAQNARQQADARAPKKSEAAAKPAKAPPPAA